MPTDHPTDVPDHRPNVHVGYQSTPKPYHRKIAELAGRYAPSNGTVIDIGCGLGTTLHLLQAERPDLSLVAADIDEVLLSKVSQEVRLHDRVLIDDVDDILHSSGRYDVVIMSHVLEHLFRPLDAVLEVNDILTEHGHAIYAVPNPLTPLVLLRSAARRDYVNRGHVYAWDRSHWINFIERIAQLDVAETTQDFVPLRPARKSRGKRLEGFEISMADVLPWFARSHITVVRKSPVQRGSIKPRLTHDDAERGGALDPA